MIMSTITSTSMIMIMSEKGILDDDSNSSSHSSGE
jgi:hypothetical protein